MSDTYQAVYDAVRSKISNADIGAAVEDVLRSLNLAHYGEMAAHAIAESFYDYRAPSAIYRPAISMDGDQWCALYGENLQDGVAGFGKSPALAMSAFDKAWLSQGEPQP